MTGIVAVGMALLACAAARSDVIYTNLGAGGTFSTDTESTASGINFYLGEITPAGGFTVGGSDCTLGTVEMALRWYDMETGQQPLVVRLLADSGGLPGTELASVQIDYWLVPAEPALVALDFSPAALTLSAGASYWLVADTGGTSWFGWMDNITGDLGRVYQNNSPNWSNEPLGDAPAFRVNGTVPEPATLALLGVGGLMMARRRIRRAITTA